MRQLMIFIFMLKIYIEDMMKYFWEIWWNRHFQVFLKEIPLHQIYGKLLKDKANLHFMVII